MQVAILGPLEVRSADGSVVPVAGARLRDLIARLALAGGKPVSTESLAWAIWADDPPADMANALQTLVSRARRVLGGGACVEQSAAGYRLAVEPDNVDALKFERLVGAGAAGEALALWRGPALADVGEFAAPYAARLEELRLDAQVTRLAGELDAGRAGAHVAELEALAAAHPLNEKVAALQMRALAATGRQADALAGYEALRGRLAQELGIDPGPELQAVHLEVLRGEARAASAAAPTNLRAQLTSFIGREDEVDRIGKSLAAYRLVTLVGPGGAGKTRLATEIAAGVRDRSPDLAPDGIWLAELASVTEAADVPQAVLGAIGLRETRVLADGRQRVTTRDARTRLLEGLASARALLVLDNCEHLIDACAHLADALLAHSPGLRIVATSREPLGITGESLFVVPPLREDPAVRLFADRAAAVSPAFRLDAASVPLVTEIVRRLDGLPLAIELAAARLRTLPLAEIARRLDDRFRLLTGGSRTALPRHRTLRAVVEWSWGLLTPAERLLAERFSVFPAGATPQAVAVVCGAPDGPGDTDELLSSLVDKSLLQPLEDGERLRMLETIREYGSEQLAARGEVGALRRRHADYYSQLMDQIAPLLLTRDQLTWLRAAQADRDNILAALRYWCDVGDARQAIALTVSFSCVSFLLGNPADVTEWAAEAVAIPGDADPDLRTIAEALYLVTQMMSSGEAAGLPQPDGLAQPDGGPDLSGLAERFDSLDISKSPLAGLLRPGYAMFAQDRERMDRYLREALASDSEWLVAAACLMSAADAENSGDIAAKREHGAEALRRFRALGERWGLSGALLMAGSTMILDGDLDGAAAAFAEARSVLEEMGSRDGGPQLRLLMADIAARRGDIDDARRLFASALVAAESGRPGMDAAVATAGAAMFEAVTGDRELARTRHEAARELLDQLSPAHPARRHLTAVVGAAGLMIALAGADLAVAREHAAAAYEEATASEDMGLLATVGGTLACLAHAADQPERAAEMLGACVAVRGQEDPTDVVATTLREKLRSELGRDGYERAYTRGQRLSRSEAISHLDPSLLATP